MDFDAIPYIRITPGAQGILKSACHPDCNPLKAASHRLLGGTLSEAGAAIGEVATRRIMNHLSGPLYPNSCGICLPPAIPGYDKEEHLMKQVIFKDRTGGMPRLCAEIPHHGDGRTGNREYVNKHRLIHHVEKLELKK